MKSNWSTVPGLMAVCSFDSNTRFPTSFPLLNLSSVSLPVDHLCVSGGKKC